MTKNKQPFIILNNQPIPWSVWGRLKKKCINEYEAGMCLYRVRDKEKIVPYLLAGIRGGWIYTPKAAEEQDGQRAAKEWVEKNVLGYIDGVI